MKLVFFGSDDFSIHVLEGIKEKFEIVVVTVPDSRKGRGRRLLPSPVKEFSIRNNIPYLTPDNPNSPSFIEKIKEISPDFFVLASYRFILKKELLSLVKYPLNIHPSLLPRYRGAAPIQRAIINGEEKTGVTVFVMNEEIDKGRIVLQKEVYIEKDETYGELSKRLAKEGVKLLMESIDILTKTSPTLLPQKGKSSYAKKIKKEETYIDWNKSSQSIHNLVRGLNPRPLARTFFNGKLIKVFRTSLCDSEGAPGEIIGIEREGPVVGTGFGSVIIKELMVEGKSKITGKEFCNGYRIKIGQKFG